MNNNIILNDEMLIMIKDISGNGISGNGLSEIDLLSEDIDKIISNIQI